MQRKSNDESSADELLPALLRETRTRFGLGVNELARRARVSAGQISRIERGLTEQPSPQTLTEIARALDRNPALLLIVAGHVDAGETRQHLKRVFRDGSEYIEEQRAWGADVSDAKRRVDDPKTELDALRAIAAEVFQTTDTVETQWSEAYGLATDRDLREIHASWPDLSVERRRKVMDYFNDQVDLSHRESTDEMREEKPDYGRA